MTAQDSMLDCSDSTFCIPSVPGMPRGKGLIFKYENVLDYGINSRTISNNELSSGEVSRNTRIQAKIKFPLVLKDKIKVAIGLSYFSEEYSFDGRQDYSFYRNLEDKDLRSIGANIYVVKPFLGNKYFLLRTSFKLNGDYFLDDIPNKDFLKFSISPLIGWKHNTKVSYAVGVALGYNFGRPSVYPLLAYNRYFNERWGLESVLPSNIKIRYSPNDKNFLYAIAQVHGASYTIRFDDPNLNTSQSLHLRKSEIRFLLSYEREIHDWIWFGVEAGLRSNVNFELSESNRRNSKVLIDNKFQTAPVINFSLFLVPPRRMLQ